MSSQLGLHLEDDWVSRNVVDAAGLEDEFDIERGKPRWAEDAARILFFPRLSQGVLLPDGRTLRIKAGNDIHRKTIDLVIRTDDQPVGTAYAAIDVERKTSGSAYLFSEGCTLPVNIPVLSMEAHQTGEYHDAAGEWKYSGKMRTFLRYPQITFFLALRHDAQVALLIHAIDIIDRERWEWIDANGPYSDGTIYVARVPRSEAILCHPATYEAESAIMAIIGPHL